MVRSDLLKKKLAGLSPEKRRLLEARLRGGKPDPSGPEAAQNTASTSPAVRPDTIPRSASGPAPLSFSQRRLWFYHQMEGSTGAYNVPLTLELTGPLDGVALIAAFDQVVERHHILRTGFQMGPDGPIQVVVGQPSTSMISQDLSLMEPLARERELRRTLNEAVAHHFDLENGPLFHAELLTLTPEKHVLIVVMHHIISDGWSIGVLLRELSAFYNARRSGGPHQLPPLPIQYADFAHWWTAQKDRFTPHLNYWLKALAGAPDLIQLPTDRPRPPVQTQNGALVGFALPITLTSALKSLGRETDGSSLYIILLAAFGVLLHRYSGQDEVVIGSPSANRNRRELEGLIGFFVNTLVPRITFNDSPSFNDLLRQTRHTALDAFTHQDLPFDLLVEALKPKRNLSHTPIFQVMFVLQNAAMDTLAIPGVTARHILPDWVNATFDLTLSMEERDDALTGAFEYNSDLFDAATIQRLCRHWRNLLNGIVDNPNQSVVALELLDEDERRQILNDWNATGHYRLDQEGPSSIHEWFEARAAATPDAVALVGEWEHLSYAALDCLADQLAVLLQSHGVGPETPVGVCLAREPVQIAALLGVLKAGAFYLPLDPAYPDSRLALMAADAGVKYIVSRSSYAARLTAFSSAYVVLDVDEAASPEHPQRPANVALEAQHPAYMIYTSGSTGRPKGVLIPHQALLNFTAHVIDAYHPEPADRVLQFASFSFDTAVEEIFPSLICGAALILRTPTMMDGGPLGFLANCEAWCVTVFDLPTAYWHELVQDTVSAGKPWPAGQRLVIIGGEQATAEALDQWRRHVGDRPALVNTYGPTETTVVATHCLLSGDDPTVGHGVPIGRPILNARAHVLDRHGRVVPVGVHGELYLGGVGLARGYRRQADLTADRFVPDPYAHLAGQRLYRTGDRVRYLPDGNIVFLGRVDHQVKLRGFRIEPGEIEAVLRKHPLVRDALVGLVHDQTVGPRLVAWLVIGAEDLAMVNVWLKQELPAHMRPSHLIPITAFPLTPNGKVDRNALPQPEARPVVKQGAERSDVEIIRAIMSEVLAQPNLTAQDDFFEMGGHSLLATRVTGRIHELMGVAVPVKALFENPTSAALADVAADARRDVAVGSRPALTATSEKGPYPLSFAQRRLWFLERDAGSTPIADAVWLNGPLSVSALADALRGIVDRHHMLRTVFGESAGTPNQRVVDVPDTVLSIIETTPDQAERLCREALAKPFDLQRGPVFRALLFRHNSRRQLLFIAMHHIVSDGWSTAVFFNELNLLYRANLEGDVSPPAEPVLQYWDYATWQRRWLDETAQAQLLAFWRTHLMGAPELLPLPLDRPRPAVRGNRAEHVLFNLGPELTTGLRNLSTKEKVSLYMTCHAVFALLLARYSGSNDIVVGVPSANRDLPALESIIGFFVNTLAVRVRLGAADGFSALLRQVRQVMLDVYAHQDMPFELLVEQLQPKRSLAWSPLVQVLFAFQNTPEAELAFPGLSLEPVTLDGGLTQFDLSLNMQPQGEGMAAAFTYSAELFKRAAIERLAAHFKNLLAAVVSNLEHRLDQLNMIGEAERSMLLGEWSGQVWTGPADRGFHEWVGESAARFPDAVALMEGDNCITYNHLETLSGLLAHRLRQAGVGSECRVGLCLGRGPAMILGLMAVMKAGGAYVPLDPDYPASRLAYLLEDGRIALVLTSPELSGRLPSGDFTALMLDPAVLVGDSGGDAEPENGPRWVCLDQLAYVIYTSGSTGNPKGVGVAHRSVGRLIQQAVTLAGVALGERVLQFAAFSFDASVLEMGLAFGSGSSLRLADRRTLMPGPMLANLLNAWCIQYWVVSPTVLAAMPLEIPLPHLKTIFCGSERVPAEVAERWSPGRRFFISYGPTETTVIVTAHHFEPGGLPLIGVPLAHARVYVADERLQLQGVGVPGELVLGGSCLARGYQGLETVTRFVPDPFSGAVGGRLYRTGDRVRLLENGSLAFMGRIDRQIKLRGFRVEPGEIETALRACTAVRAAVVMLVGEPEPRLTAFVITESGGGDLRAVLRGRLPEHLIPAQIVRLEAFPTTLNGKLDERALRQRADDELGHMPASVKNDGPIPPEQAVICAIWASVLALPQVGPEQNFFDLGGHSLLAGKVVARVRDAFRLDLPVRAVFEHPTPAAFSHTVREAVRADHPAVPAILPVDQGDDVPLSFAQERLWFLDQLEGAGAAYHIAGALQLMGRLDVLALERAFQTILSRHQALRTTFQNSGGVPIQTMAAEVGFRLKVVDVTAEKARRQCEIAASFPFDLAVGPLWRVLLLRVDADRWILTLAMHHIISDGWSMDVLFHELSVLYAAYREGAPSPLEPLTVQYSDYVAWQRSWLTDEVLDMQLAYWRARLTPLPAPLELPADKPRPALQTYNGATLAFTVKRETAAGLRRFSRDFGASMFMTLSAAFAVLLARYGRVRDLTIGVPVANRAYQGLEPLIGFFVNSLVLRVGLRDGMCFHELVDQLRRITLDAHAHQDLPFDRLVDALQPPRDMSRSPLFQVMFSHQNAGGRTMRLPGLDAAPYAFNDGTAQFDLSLSFAEDGDRLHGGLEYNTDLFFDGTASRMVGHLLNLLDGIAAAPGGSVTALSLMNAAERRKLMTLANRYGGLKAVMPIHHQITARALAEPDHIAAVLGSHCLSYGELNRKAEFLAGVLRRHGVGPEVPVGVGLHRSLELIVALLGVLKAGGVYLPLEPSLPEARLQYMARDAGAALVLDAGRGSFGSDGVKLLSLPDVLKAADEPVYNASAQAPADSFALDHPAYMIYTSGSTGQPKGVMISHRAAAEHFQSVGAYYGTHSRDRYLLFASTSFDTSVEQMFGALLAGATLVIRGEAIWSVEECMHHSAEQGVTIWDLAPRYLHELLMVWSDAPAKGPGPYLRLMITGGDVMPADLPTPWRRVARPGLRLVNGYGPTEAAITATSIDLPRGVEPSRACGRITIGHLLSDRSAYVLDEAGKLLPVGVVGELVLGGIGLARGYASQPLKTALSFRPDPFSQEPGCRLYYTGDLARYLPDGDLDFIGRVDHQVKIRGFRIELGEVEAALIAEDDVRACAVVVRAVRGQETLVAYVEVEPAFDQAMVRERLKTRLPDYMIPSHWMVMAALPMTASGKVDRKLFPEPEGPASDAREVMSPRTDLEYQLLQIWAELLARDGFGIRDSFFDLGGHSMLAVRLVTRLAKITGCTLRLSDLFREPTIEGLAARLSGDAASGGRSPLVALQSKGSSPALYCIHPDGGTVMCYLEMVQAMGVHRPVYGLQAKGAEDDSEPMESVETMAEHYLAAIRGQQPKGPYCLLGWSFGGLVAYEMARMLEREGENAIRLVLLDSAAPIQADWPNVADQAEILVNIFGRDLPELRLEALRELGDDQQLHWILELAQDRQVFPPDFGLQHARRFIKTIKANTMAYQDYLPEGSYKGRIDFIKATEIEDAAYAREEAARNHAGVWCGYTGEGVIEHPIKATHRTMVQQPAVTDLARLVTGLLSR